MKGKTGNPSRRIKLEENKKTKKLQKKIEFLKKQVHQTKEEVIEASNKWEKKYFVDTGKQKRENIEFKIRLRAKKISK